MLRLAVLPHPKRSDTPEASTPARPVAAVAQPRGAAPSTVQRSLPGLAPVTGGVRERDDLSARLGKIEATKEGGTADSKRMKLNDYADHTVCIGMGDYRATSAEKNNFVTGKCMPGVPGTEYKSLLPEEEKLIKAPQGPRHLASPWPVRS